MSRTFTCTLDTVDDLIRQLEDYKRSLSQKCAELSRAVAEDILGRAQTGFNDAIVNDHHKPHNLTVTVENRGDAVCEVIASGPDVAFIEFGAGVHYNGAVGTSPHPKGAELGYTIGSYGNGNGAKDYWRYNDGRWHFTHGTVCQAPLYNADLEAQQHITQTAERIFSR